MTAAVRRVFREDNFDPGQRSMMGFATSPLGVLRLLVVFTLLSLMGSVPLPAQESVSFSPARRDFPVRNSAYSVAVGDFNGDSVQDWVVGSGGTGSMSILLGNADGSFGAAQETAAGSDPVVGNFNGDLIEDLVVERSGTILIALGKGDGSFEAAQQVAGGSDVVVGDFNGDSRQDLVVAKAGPDTVSILFGNGDGTFGSAQEVAAGSSPQSADFNGDRVEDLAVLDGRDLTILLGNGDGTFAVGEILRTGKYFSVFAIGDFNGDLRPDLMFDNGLLGRTEVLLGNGDGTFSYLNNFSTSGYEAFVPST